MSEQGLRHLAVVIGSAPESTADCGRAVLASCGKAGVIAREAFVVAPELRALSWLDPGVDTLLANATAAAAARACAAGARTLAAVAADLGIAFRVCGRLDGLAPEEANRPARAPDDRTLLWFQRYSGRNEIARAATRFLEARPGTRLADPELDAWLDTAGIPDPDLLLYVGGSLEPRDVLLWQGSYAEISHAPESMSAFTTDGLRRAVSDFRDRQRRFGR